MNEEDGRVSSVIPPSLASQTLCRTVVSRRFSFFYFYYWNRNTSLTGDLFGAHLYFIVHTDIPATSLSTTIGKISRCVVASHCTSFVPVGLSSRGRYLRPWTTIGADRRPALSKTCAVHGLDALSWIRPLSGTQCIGRSSFGAIEQIRFFLLVRAIRSWMSRSSV